MRILMIEDQPRFVELMIHVMEGLDIEVAENLAQARACLDANRYDLILVDLGLPDSEGLDTLRALRGYKTPKVVLTARFDLSAEASALGASDYINKATPVPEIYERVLFNVSKVQRSRKRFEPNVFEQIKGYLSSAREPVEARPELTLAV